MKLKVDISAQAAMMMRQAGVSQTELLQYLMRRGFPIGNGAIMEYLEVRDGRQFGASKPVKTEVEIL